MTHLSPHQIKVIEKRRAPFRHAMDRLKERHFPDIDDDLAEQLIDTMASLCGFQHKFGMSRTATIVNVEKEDSVIVDLDMFEDRHIIRVCYDPQQHRIRTVFPPIGDKT